MTLQEVCAVLGRSENTILHSFQRTQKNLRKKGIILSKKGRYPDIKYEVQFPQLDTIHIYTIYMHRNKVNGKIYIGQTKQKLNDRWKNGQGYKKQPYFYRAIQKYGWDNFEHIVIEEKLTLEQANEREQYWISYYQSNTKEKGYNLVAGGKNGACSEELKKHLSERLSGENAPFYGKKHDEEYKKNMSKQMKEKWSNEEYRKQTCENMKKNHANFKGGNHPQAKQVKRQDTGEIFSCCGEAAISIGKDWVKGGKNIAKCCRGERKTAYGYSWEYIEEKETI